MTLFNAISSGLQLAGTVGGAAASFFGGRAQERSANRSAKLFEDILKEIRRDIRRSRKELDPFRKTGGLAIDRLRDLFITGDIPFELTPSAQFLTERGTAARDASAAARGQLFSGGQQKRITEFGQDVASTDVGNQFNRLLALSGAGQAAVNQRADLAGLGSRLALAGTGGLANQLGNAGAARASSFVGPANVFNQGASQFATLNALRNFS